jgi:class 3 adenylate cyclase
LNLILANVAAEVARYASASVGAGVGCRTGSGDGVSGDGVAVAWAQAVNRTAIKEITKRVCAHFLSNFVLIKIDLSFIFPLRLVNCGEIKDAVA